MEGHIPSFRRANRPPSIEVKTSSGNIHGLIIPSQTYVWQQPIINYKELIDGKTEGVNLYLYNGQLFKREWKKLSLLYGKGCEVYET